MLNAGLADIEFREKADSISMLIFPLTNLMVPMTMPAPRFNRRHAIQLVLTILGYRSFSPYIENLSAQTIQTPIANLGTTEKVLLDGLLYKNLDAYLAFDKVADEVTRKITQEKDAVGRFDAECGKIKLLIAEDKLKALDAAIQRGTLLTCAVTPVGSQTTASVERLLSPIAPNLAVAGTISRHLDQQLGTVPGPLKVAGEVIATVSSAKLIPIVPSATVGKFFDDRMKVLTQESGVSSLIAQSVELVAKGGQLTATVQSALSGLSEGFGGWANGIDLLRKGNVSAPDIQNVQAMASAMSASVALLKNIHGISDRTLNEASSAINVAGSVLSGALAGASFGPVGSVIGGAVSLLGGIFGGRGRTDRSAQALAQIQGEIAQLGQAITQLSQQIAAGFDALSKQMNSQFQTLSDQIQELRDEVNKDFSSLEAEIKEFLEISLQNTLAAFHTDVEEHELQYRIAATGAPSNVLQTASDVRKGLENSIVSVLNALSSSSFAGKKSFEDFLNDQSVALVELTHVMGSATQLPWMPPIFSNTAHYLHGGHPNAFSLQVYSYDVVNRLQDVRFGSKSDINGASLIHGLQEQCITDTQLDKFLESDEGKLVADRYEITALIPDAQDVPPALAPQDLWYLISKVKEATDSLSDTGLVEQLLDKSVDLFKSRISTQYLLTGQNALPLLLYIRRRIVATLARSSSIVFCNPFMSAVDVLRRLLSIKLSGPDFASAFKNTSKIDFSNLTQVDHLFRGYFLRERMPLAKVTDVSLQKDHIEDKDGIAVTVPDPLPQMDFFEKTVAAVMNSKEPDVIGYVKSQADLIVTRCAWSLPDVVRDIDGTAGTKDASLTKHLKIIRSSCLILGVIERCVQLRLQALEKAAGSAAVPPFKTWLEGFLEYGTVAEVALGQESADEVAYSKAILESLLGRANSTKGNITNFAGDPEIPAGLPEEARPYPVQLGQFWGWGAEDVRPDVGTAPELIAALLRPECALVGENGAVLAATQLYSEMNIELQMLRGRSDLLSMVSKNMSGGIRDELRRQLTAT